MEIKTYALAPTSVRTLKKNMPDNVFPISLTISLAATPEQNPLEYEIQQKGGKIVRERFSETNQPFPVYESNVVYIPTRVVTFINPLERQNIKEETKQSKRRDSLGEAYENDEQVLFRDFMDALRLAEESIENSTQPGASDRIYMSNFRVCRIPSQFVIDDPDATDLYENVGIDPDFYSDRNTDERECWIAEFTQAADSNSKINIGQAKEQSKMANEMAPGRMTVPCLLSKVEQVYAHGLEGRLASKIRCAYYKSKPEVDRKNKDERFYPREYIPDGETGRKDWVVTNGYEKMIEVFGNNFSELSEKDMVKRPNLKGEERERSIFDVKWVS